MKFLKSELPAVQGRTVIIQTRKCLNNGARRGPAPRRSELNKSMDGLIQRLLK